MKHKYPSKNQKFEKLNRPNFLIPIVFTSSNYFPKFATARNLFGRFFQISRYWFEKTNKQTNAK